MKYRFRDRLAIMLGSLLVICIGLGLFVLGLQLQSVDLSDANGAFFTWPRVAVLVAGLFCVLFGGYVLLLPSKGSEKHRFVIQQTDNGELRISIKAIENLVQKCIDMHNEISVVSMRVDNDRDGVRIDLCISLANNISIPLAVASLQKQIKQYLLASSGIDVRDVCVSVETASSDVGESPYLVSDMQQVGREHQQQQAPKKKPLHQRIFGKDAPTVMLPPDPPKPPVAEQEVKPPEESHDAPPAEEAPEEIAPADENKDTKEPLSEDANDE